MMKIKRQKLIQLRTGNTTGKLGKGDHRSAMHGTRRPIKSVIAMHMSSKRNGLLSEQFLVIVRDSLFQLPVICALQD
jgi:hypothetical protein